MRSGETMRSADECRAKASAMELRAGLCHDAAPRNSFLDLARIWREVARQAEWQDAQGFPIIP